MSDAKTLRSHLPNALTAGRIAFGIAFPFLPPWTWIPVCVIAAATEYLDGYLSRLWGAESHLGRMLDPVADKVFLAGVLIAFLVAGYITAVELVLVAIRDMVVASGCIVLVLVGHRNAIARLRPRIPGKVATWFQYGFMLYVLLWLQAPTVLVGLTAAASFVAAVDYLRAFAVDQTSAGRAFR